MLSGELTGFAVMGKRGSFRIHTQTETGGGEIGGVCHEKRGWIIVTNFERHSEDKKNAHSHRLVMYGQLQSIDYFINC